jgi:hypothetical protein
MLRIGLPGRLAKATLVLIACAAFGSQARAMRFLTVTDVPTTASWGATSHGMRLSLSLNQTSVSVGDPILATIDLENLGPVREVFLGCNMEDWYDIKIVDGVGRMIPHQRVGPVDCYSTPSSSTLKYDSVLEVTIRLDNIFRISEAGSYTVTATSTLHPPYIPHLDANGNQAYDSPIIASLVSNSTKIVVTTGKASKANVFPADRLRHVRTTLLLERGANIEVAHNLLGHASAWTTLGTYAHLPPTGHASAASIMNEFLAENSSEGTRRVSFSHEDTNKTRETLQGASLVMVGEVGIEPTTPRV